MSGDRGPAAVPGLRWVDGGDASGAVVGPEQQVLARYRWDGAANHPYLDELRPLSHRGVLTTHAPHDHRWHHGLWWSWKFIDDVLFWEDHPGYGGNRGGLGCSVVQDHAAGDEGGAVVVSQQLAWRADATGEVPLTEERTLTAHLDAHLPGAWALDWDQTWTAARALTLSTTPWPRTPWGGYAGLNYRPARSMAAGERILAAGALAGAQDVHGSRAAWGAYTGCVDGAGDDEPDRPATGGVALLQHPGDDARPDPLYVAAAVDGFGFLATAPLMHHERALVEGEQLRRRTRVLVLPSAAGAAEVERASATWVRRALTTTS